VHHEVRLFVEQLSRLYPRHFRGATVLEVGSLNVNGTVRDFFTQCVYLGIDLGPGPGVDEVTHICDGPDDCLGADVVISCEALEHDRRWRSSLPAMWSRVRPGGLLIVTCAGPARPRHGVHGSGEWCSPHTLDYYQGLGDEDLRAALDVDWHTDSTDLDTRAYAVKPGKF
jgi:hypothetical protein